MQLKMVHSDVTLITFWLFKEFEYLLCSLMLSFLYFFSLSYSSKKKLYEKETKKILFKVFSQQPQGQKILYLMYVWKGFFSSLSLRPIASSCTYSSPSLFLSLSPSSLSLHLSAIHSLSFTFSSFLALLILLSLSPQSISPCMDEGFWGPSQFVTVKNIC